MVNVTEAIESSYVNVDLVRESKTKKAVIIDEGEFRAGTYEGKEYTKFEFAVEIDGKRKMYGPNMDSAKNISKAYGVESKGWVGKVIGLQIIKKNGKDVILAIPMSPPIEQ